MVSRAVDEKRRDYSSWLSSKGNRDKERMKVNVDRVKKRIKEMKRVRDCGEGECRK